jgi:methylglutaconyl-CoA hydratase
LIAVSAIKPAVVQVTLNRPDKRNALNVALMTALCEQIESQNQDGATRVIILRGEGPVFCAGLDLAEAQDPSLATQSAELVARVLLTIRRSRAVTIAAVHGAAIAGGAGLMTACDLVVAAEETRIGYPEVRRGLVAGLVTTLLRRQVGERHARELLVLGELIDAHRAHAMGLVNRVAPKDRTMESACALADSILKGAPGAIARSRVLLDELWPVPFEAGLAHALDCHKDIRVSEEAMEGMRAFTEKRLPDWDPRSRR